MEQLSARVMQKLVTCDETPIILSFKTVLVAKFQVDTKHTRLVKPISIILKLVESSELSSCAPLLVVTEIILTADSAFRGSH